MCINPAYRVVSIRTRTRNRTWRYVDYAIMFLYLLCLLNLTETMAVTWCDLDTGYTTITDGRGFPHSVFVSVRRDGSVWLRVGVDRKSADWVYNKEFRQSFQDILLTKDTLSMLSSLNYSDSCVLTDITMSISMDYGWHPSYVKTYNSLLKTNEILVFRHNKDCHMNTTLELATTKQGFTCHGGQHNACGFRNLPPKGQTSITTFITMVNFEPEGVDYVVCQQPRSRNSYTFSGSYYYAYIKLANCYPLTDSRQLGHEAKIRPHEDTATDIVIIPDPQQTALASGTIIGWHVFAKTTSIQHKVYLQVWRPHSGHAHGYYLVDQTLFEPVELRFQEVPLPPDRYLSLSKGDVLGLYFQQYNPIGYSTVPCASSHQPYLYAPSTKDVRRGRVLNFESALMNESACRQYSFTAILANKSSSKLADDWSCSNNKENQLADTRKRSESASRTTNSHNKNGGKGEDGKGMPVLPFNQNNEHANSDMAISVNYILLIIGGLLLLMIIIGGLSYYRAIKS